MVFNDFLNDLNNILGDTNNFALSVDQKTQNLTQAFNDNYAVTPVITTDFGVFSETVVNGVNGYRCKIFADFLKAAKDVKKLDRKAIRQDAINKYSLEAVGKQYEDYFKRLDTLWGDGWYE